MTNSEPGGGSDPGVSVCCETVRPNLAAMRKVISLLILALMLSACVGSGTGDTTTTTLDPLTERGWNDVAFRHAVSYCQASEAFGSCTLLITTMRDHDECSVEGALRVIDHLDQIEEDPLTDPNERSAARAEITSHLQTEGDCLGYFIPSG